MINVFKFFGKFPISFLRGLGAISSCIYWIFSKKFRLKFKRNWDIANKFSNGSLDQFSYFAAVKNSGASIFELPKIWCDKKLINKIETKDLILIGNLLKQKKGLICLTPHMGSFELIPRVISQKYPVNVLYKPSPNRHFEKIFQELRPSDKITMVTTSFSGVKKLLYALKKGEVVGLLPDQVPPKLFGTYENFFGKPAYTMTLAAKLVISTGAPVVWISIVYKANCWKLKIEHWNLENNYKADKKNFCKLINEKIQSIILKEPEFYLWGYDRFKLPKNK